MSAKPNKQRELSDAWRDVFEEFFNDYFKHRRQVYLMNFVRGVWFGLGSVIGGTLVVAFVLWVLTLFGQIPFLTDVIEAVKKSLEEARN